MDRRLCLLDYTVLAPKLENALARPPGCSKKGGDLTIAVGGRQSNDIFLPRWR